jgi:S-(hydroxymethyl)glutathione dehydrogenase/alcohol dehydrogenase
MKAAVCPRFGEPLRIEDVAVDAAGLGEVGVAIAACAICHSDIHFMDGAWGGVLPAVYGHEAAGVVDEVGPGVARLAPGDHVIVTLIRSCGGCFFCSSGEPTLCEADFPRGAEGPLRADDGRAIHQGLKTGAFAERVVVDQSQVVPVPPDMPHDAASLLACGVITGVGAVVNTARVQPLSGVVVIGSGGVGLNAVQGARLCGAQPIIAIDLAPAKLEAALAFGATHAIGPEQGDIQGAVRGLTGGRGADYAFVTAGAKAAIEQGLGLLRRGGTLVVVGMPASGVTVAYEPGGLANDGQRILGSKMGSTRLRVDVPKLVELYRQRRLKLDELISGRYPLAAINEAVAAVRRGEALRNVIVY